ncbi:MAG TPA: HdeD family acid-resistance protein [Kofleriaceae bacterium]|nr:HdeD family acid-resistance protein [Kofleriaceae bacterium]
MMPYHWRWWTVVLRGLVAIAFGIFALFAPTKAYFSLVVLFGVFAVIDGVLAFGLGIKERAYHPGAMIARGAVSLAAGLITLFWPNITATALLILIASWAIVAGVIDIVMAVRLRSVIQHEWLLGLEGALSVAFGVLLFLAPLAGAVVLGLWVGAYALIFGGMLVEAGLRLRSYTHTVHEIEGTVAHAH